MCLFALGETDKNGACHFIFQSPWWSLVKLLSGNPTVCSWPLSPTSLLICWKWTKPGLHRPGAPAEETRVVLLLWCGAAQEEVPCAKFITVKMQLFLTAAAAAAVVFYLPWSLSSLWVYSVVFLLKDKHLICVQADGPFVKMLHSKIS